MQLRNVQKICRCKSKRLFCRGKFTLQILPSISAVAKEKLQPQKSTFVVANTDLQPQMCFCSDKICEAATLAFYQRRPVIAKNLVNIARLWQRNEDLTTVIRKRCRDKPVDSPPTLGINYRFSNVIILPLFFFFFLSLSFFFFFFFFLGGGPELPEGKAQIRAYWHCHDWHLLGSRQDVEAKAKCLLC